MMEVALVWQVHGGTILKMMENAGFISAMRIEDRRDTSVVFGSMQSCSFRQPMLIGDLCRIEADVLYTHDASMEVEVPARTSFSQGSKAH